LREHEHERGMKFGRARARARDEALSKYSPHTTNKTGEDRAGLVQII